MGGVVFRRLGFASIALWGFVAGALTLKPLDGPGVVDALFRLHNSVLQDFELTQPKIVKTRGRNGETVEIQRGKFGGSRLEPFVPGHPYLNAEAKDAAALADAKRAVLGWREWVFLMGSKTKPTTVENLKYLTGKGWGAILGKLNYPEEADALAMAKEALMRPNGKVVRPRGKWYWEARTVKIGDARCLSCHTQSKVGDPVGVLVYALYPDPKRTAK